jgi:ribosomal protein L11 methyltransferase
MEWWDIYVQVPEGMTDAVSAYLQHLGSAGVVIHEGAVLSPDGTLSTGQQAGVASWTVLYGAFPQDEALATRICALQLFLDTLPRRTLEQAWKLSCRPLQGHDYLTQWQHFFQPLYIGTRLVIRPPWDTTVLPPDVVSLVLDPGQAFGTGLHPTTHLCLCLLAQRLSGNQAGRLLDVGCGSGILSLAALKLGLETAVGVDVDAQAVRVAARNAELNSLQARAQFLHGSVDIVSGPFAVLTANIFLGPLVDMMDSFVQRLMPQGWIILSGILAHQELALRAAMQTAGLEVRQRLEEAGWVALEGQHLRVTAAPD